MTGRGVDAEARYEDAVFMLSMGEHPERAAARLGMTIKSFNKMLDRRKREQPHPDSQTRAGAYERDGEVPALRRAG